MSYRRVTKSHPCPVCGKPDWCLVSDNAAICPRNGDGAERYIDNAGYLHLLGDSVIRDTRKIVSIQPALRQRDRVEIDAPLLAGKFCAAMTQPKLLDLAIQLIVAPGALNELVVGWFADWQAYTFPMRDGDGTIVGIRTRHLNGDKRSIPGSRAGLFIPTDNDARKGPIYLCEGPTDTSALLTIGMAAFGRPSCMGSHKQIHTFLRRGRRRELYVVADNDGPGRAGAVKLCEFLNFGRIVSPPQAVKDIRERVGEVFSVQELGISGEQSNEGALR